MRKVLVIDDEAIQRRVLGKMIREAMPSYEVFEASNGKAALEVMSNESIEIVFTDIRMPIMDGFEFVEQMNGIHKDIKVIVLSGYRFFEYAQKALRLGAFDYLLKPIKQESIAELLRKLEKISEDESKAKLQIDGSRTVYFEHLLNNLVGNNISEQHLSEITDMFHFRGYGMAILYKLEKEILDENIKKELFDIVQAEFSGFANVGSFVAKDQANQFVTIVTMEQNMQIGINEILNRIDAKFKGKGIYTKFFGIGKQYINILQFASHSYVEAQLAVQAGFFIEGNKIINFSDVERKRTKSRMDLTKEIELLQNAIRKGNEDLLVTEVCKLFNLDLDNGIPHLESWKKLFINVLYQVFPLTKEFVDDETYNRNIFTAEQKLLKATHVFGFQEEFLQQMIDCTKLIQSVRGNKHSNLVDNCISYIDKHFAEEISLESEAQRLFISPNYLSQLVKKQLDTSVTKYVLKTRIKHARDLLKNTDLRVYEVSLKVGYKDEKYFHRVFKNQMGFTPEEYRRNSQIYNIGQNG
ncbi:MAG: hypothetical protein RLY98_855 [Bacteroidota bacterium]|jgi:two-component system response regulator YesN